MSRRGGNIISFGRSGALIVRNFSVLEGSFRMKDESFISYYDASMSRRHVLQKTLLVAKITNH